MKRFGILILACCVSLPVMAKVSQFTLKNGLHILVKEDHRAPVVVQQVWYKVGSNYEPNGITGLSHMLEHMMFKGTHKLKPGEFSRQVAKMGGEENAFTVTDYTVFYQVIGQKYLPQVMALEADRMHNLVLKNTEFQKEREVVTEERRWRVEDKPGSKLYEQFKAMAYMASPEHHPVIGWMSDIRHYTVGDLRKWYHRWYAPNNATLVVVGDVQPKQVLAWAKKYYGHIKSKKIVPPKPQIEPKQTGERRIVYKGAVHTPSVLMGFHVPTLATAKTPQEKQEVYALSMLADVLDGDDSARLTQNLIRGSETLVSAGAGYDAMQRLATLFILEGAPSKGRTPKQVEADLWSQINLLKKQRVKKSTLKRLWVQSEANHIFAQDSIQAQAMVLGSLVSVGLPYDTYDHLTQKLSQITPAQIQAVAKKYLTRDNLTVGILLPNGEKASKRANQLPTSGGLR